MARLKIPAVYMRGGTTKGVILRSEDLPVDPDERDALLLRMMGSPDPYGKQMDGMGGGSSSTSKVVILSPSEREDCDVDYLFAQIPIDRAFVDWSGSCGNLVPAVACYAVDEAMVPAPAAGEAPVRIWQTNLGRALVAYVPVSDGQVVEAGELRIDGVAFPGAEIRIEYPDPAGTSGKLYPTGRPTDVLTVPTLGEIEVTLVDAGMQAVLVDATALGLTATERPAEFERDTERLSVCEEVRAAAAVAMRLCETAEEASRSRLHTPKIAFVAPPASHHTAGGRMVEAGEIDLTARILSMGRMHHAMTGTGAVALAAAAATPGTVVSRITGLRSGEPLRFAHASGVMTTSVVTATGPDGAVTVTKAVMSRTARRLMEGFVCLP